MKIAVIQHRLRGSIDGDIEALQRAAATAGICGADVVFMPEPLSLVGDGAATERFYAGLDGLPGVRLIPSTAPGVGELRSDRTAARGSRGPRPHRAPRGRRVHDGARARAHPGRRAQRGRARAAERERPPGRGGRWSSRSGSRSRSPVSWSSRSAPERSPGRSAMAARRSSTRARCSPRRWARTTRRCTQRSSCLSADLSRLSRCRRSPRSSRSVSPTTAVSSRRWTTRPSSPRRSGAPSATAFGPRPPRARRMVESRWLHARTCKLSRRPRGGASRTEEGTHALPEGDRRRRGSGRRDRGAAAAAARRRRRGDDRRRRGAAAGQGARHDAHALGRAIRPIGDRHQRLRRHRGQRRGGRHRRPAAQARHDARRPARREQGDRRERDRAGSWPPRRTPSSCASPTRST